MTAASIADMVVSGFGRVPPEVRRKLFVALFRLFYYLSPRQRLIATYNLRRAFPEKSLDEIRRIVLGVYRNMGIVSADLFTLPRLTRENIGALVEVEGLEHCKQALEKEKGLLIFGAHFGNWELSAAVAPLLIKPGVFIYRPLDSAILDRMILKIRSATGNRLLIKENAIRPMIRSLRQNEILGMLIDQNVAWHEGVFVNYLGRPACTTDGLALLALHTGAPVIPAFMTRLPDGRYRFVIGQEIELSRTGDQDADALVNTQRFTKVIEEMVRRHPDQWLWVHQRWKTQRCQVQM